jgi:hypothetical protein
MVAEAMLLNHGKWHLAWRPPALQLVQFEQDTQLPCKQKKITIYISVATAGS